MLFTSFNLPEDVHLLSGRSDHHTAGGVRVDARPLTPRRGERRNRR